MFLFIQVLHKFYVKLYPRAHKILVLVKKVYDENRKKDKKTLGNLYKIIKRGTLSFKEKENRFIAQDIEPLFIKGSY